MTTRSIFAGEFVGTFILVFFGCGSVAAAVLHGAQIGIFQVAIVWGIAIALAIFLTGGMSGAHLNPAVTLAFAAFRKLPPRQIPNYLLSQFAGAFLAAAILFVLFGGSIEAFESKHGIVRGAPGSEASAMIFGEFFPNPGGDALSAEQLAWMPTWRAFLVELIGTAILVFAIFGLTDERQANAPGILLPAMVGLTVTILISLLGPLTMGAFNPTRDLAPRIFSSIAGWGSVPFSVNGMGWLTVYIFGPFSGGLIGGAFWKYLMAESHPVVPDPAFIEAVEGEELERVNVARDS